jgi:hypothetical protein
MEMDPLDGPERRAAGVGLRGGVRGNEVDVLEDVHLGCERGDSTLRRRVVSGTL